MSAFRAWSSWTDCCIGCTASARSVHACYCSAITAHCLFMKHTLMTGCSPIPHFPVTVSYSATSVFWLAHQKAMHDCLIEYCQMKATVATVDMPALQLNTPLLLTAAAAAPHAMTCSQTASQACFDASDLTLCCSLASWYIAKFCQPLKKYLWPTYFQSCVDVCERVMAGLFCAHLAFSHVLVYVKE